MGQDPIPIKEFREYLRVVRALLNNEEVDYTYRDRTTSIVWQDHGHGFRNTESPIPIYVAANGPERAGPRACMVTACVQYLTNKRKF